MYSTFDSKLFYGKELGTFEEIVPNLMKLIDEPPRKCTNVIDQVNWINTQLPEGLWLEVTYPRYSCPVSEMKVHFSLLEDGDIVSMKDMKKVLRNANYVGYGYYLGKLDLEYTEPVFYTRYYIYD